MGQTQASATFSPNNNMEPGTYRIIHGESNKALRIEEDDQRIVIWDRESQSSNRQATKKDHWFLLPSGDGYVFKHCQRGTYMSISFKSDYPYPVLATRYPTTWVIYTKESGKKLECVIATDKVPSRVVSLDSGTKDSGENGDKLHLTRLYKDHDECWRLERIGDATGEAEQLRLLRQQLKIAKTELVETQSKLKIAEEQLEVNMTELANVRSESNEKTADSGKQREALDQTIKQLSTAMEELSEKEAKMLEKDRESSEKNELIRIKNAELAEKTRIIAQLEMVRGPIIEQSEMTSNLLRLQGTRAGMLSPPPEPAPRAITHTVQSRSRPTTALDVKLAELGWDSDSD